ncbi:hypothetical protein Sjap_000888 [Stephania japonica]|uniref:Nardilysin n=1 Tax=Stephania japonica TaxID=461633 RepID=A0AAP0KKI5_9MAGN
MGVGEISLTLLCLGTTITNYSKEVALSDSSLLCLSSTKARAMAITFSSDNLVVKAPTDRRLYRVLHFSNGLCAVLVHDPEIYPDGPPDPSNALENGHEQEFEEEDDDEDDVDDDEDEEDEEESLDDDEEDAENVETDAKKSGSAPPTKKAAAAMCVGMGSFSDPAEAQGLSHFLVGLTEIENGSQVIGFGEVETDLDGGADGLQGGVREERQEFWRDVKRTTVEHMLFMGSAEFPDENEYDSYLSKHGGSSNAYTETEHTCYYFDVKREFLKGALKRFSQFFISPLVKVEAMEREVLAVDSEPLDTLQDWVLELFSNVKEGQPVKTKIYKEAPIWKSDNLYRLEAVKDIHILDLNWTMPCLHKEYLQKPQDYLAHLLGHEGKGSLLYFLKAKGLATSLSAGVGDDGIQLSSVAYIFSMAIYLTDAGIEKIYEVIGFVYQYLKLLRQDEPQEWVFKELQDIGNMEFKFAEEEPQDDYASDLAANMLLYPEEHIIYGDYAYEIWDEKLIKHVLSFLKPENMRVDLMTKIIDKQSKDIKYEPWFGSQYIEEPIPMSLLELWRDPPEVEPSFHLPSKNEFMPCDFTIHCVNSPNHPTHSCLPKCIIDQPMMKLWYKLDKTFKVPRANTYFLITVKRAYNDVKSCVLTELFINLLKDELNEILYQAGVAKLGTALSIIGDKIELKIYGFNDKLPVLLSKILATVSSFLPADDRFKVIKEDMARAFRNTNMKPLNHSTYLRLQLLRENFYDVDEKLVCLTNLSLSDLKMFVSGLLSQLYIEGLCHGNLSEEEVLAISDILRSKLSTSLLPMELRHKDRVLCLPSGANLVRDIHVKNKLEVNSVVQVYYQIEQDFGVDSTRWRSLADLFSDIVEEPLFNQLRTKEQLGYVVECGPRLTYRILGFCFCVQSSKFDPLHLHARIDSFISGLKKLMDGLDAESFENHKSGLIAKKLEKYPSLNYETNHLWGQIVDKRYLFDMSEKEAEELKGIHKSDIIDWYNTYLGPNSPKCRRLAIRVWGCETDMQARETSLEHVSSIEDLEAFKMSATFYSSLC